VYDTIIVGGGSAARHGAQAVGQKRQQILLCEAGQDTPPGNEPPEIRDSYSGTAYFDRGFTGRSQGHDAGRQPQQSREAYPPLRKYEQARVLGGGSSNQRPVGQPRRADRL